MDTLKVFTTKLYTRYYYSRGEEEYQPQCDKHFPTKQEAEKYIDENDRGFGNSDTSFHYSIVEQNITVSNIWHYVEPDDFAKEYLTRLALERFNP